MKMMAAVSRETTVGTIWLM